MTFKIQVETIISTKRNRIFWWIKNDSVVQTKPFKLGFRFTNIDDKPTKGFTIKDIIFRSAGGQDIVQTIDESFYINALNPCVSTEIWVDELGTYMHGLANINMRLAADDPSDNIETYQKDPFTKKISKYRIINQWLDFLHVTSSAENTQNTNNSLLVFLTYLMTIVVIANFFLFLKYQIKPKIDEYNKNKFEAINYCRNNPDGEWPKATGGMFKCSEVLEIAK